MNSCCVAFWKKIVKQIIDQRLLWIYTKNMKNIIERF